MIRIDLFIAIHSLFKICKQHLLTTFKIEVYNIERLSKEGAIK